MPKHSVLTGADLHEPKGAAAANNEDIMVADGVGGTSWVSVTTLERPYGEIYSQESDSQSLSGIGTTAIKMTTFANDGEVSASGCTISSANNRITMTTGGHWWIQLNMSFETTSVADSGNYKFMLYKNGVANHLEAHRAMSGSSDRGALSFGGIVDVTVNDYVEVYVSSDNAGNTDDINVLSAYLQAVEIGS